MPRTASLPPLAWLGITLALLPFPVKRAMLLGELEVLHWLAWDYGIRFIMLAGVILVYESGAMRPPPPRASWLKSVLVFAVALAVVFAAIMAERIFGYLLPSYFEYFTAPVIHNLNLLAFDLTAGILLVVISEEFVYRRLVFSLLERFGFRKIFVLLSSSVLFALIHITSGLASAIFAFCYGFIFGFAYYWTGRLSICIALHYFVDFLIFGLNASNKGVFGPAASS